MNTAETATTTSPASGNVSVAGLAEMLKKSRATSNGAAAKSSNGAAGAAGANGASTAATAPGTEASTGASQETETETATTTADAGASAETAGSSSGPSQNEEGSDGTNLETEDTEGEVDPDVESEDVDGEGEGEDAEGEESPDDLKSLKKNWRKARKRIGTLTRKLREAEALLNGGAQQQPAQTPAAQSNGEEAAAAGAEVRSLPGVDGRFAGDARLVGVVKELAAANATLGAAEDALERLAESGEETITLKENGKEFTFNRGELRQIVRNARNAAGELTSRKGHLTAAAEARWNNELQQANAEAAQSYPWVLKKDALEWKDARAILGMMPGVADRADRLLVVADFLEGRKARMARGTKPKAALAGQAASAAGGNGSLHPTTKKPAVIPATGGAAAGTAGRGDQAKAQVKQSEGNFRKSGRTEDLKELLKARKDAALAAG